MAATMRIPTEFTAVDKFTSVVKQMTAGVSNFSNSTTAAIDRFNSKANKIANNMAIVGTSIIAPLGVALNSAIKFEDKMADVAKTTGLTSEESEKYGKSILDLSKKTRTSIEQLQDIGVVAGTIGVAKDELEAFTKAGNEFAIALGSDFGSTEEAVTQVAKLKNLFKETRNIDIATSMTKAGSAINEVSNMAGSSDNINDFMLRIGALPDSMKPTIQQSAALGGFLEDAGLSAEIAAGGFSNLILTAGKNLPAFADQMGMTIKEAKNLYATDPTQFAIKFSKSLNKMSPDALAKKLAFLKIGSQESIKVVGALGSGYEKLDKAILTSNDAFAKGTSISDEAAKKNDTMAGKLAIAKNNMEALSITVGTKLAPVLTDLVDTVSPILEKFTKWADENPKLIKGIAYFGMILLGLSAAIKVVTITTELWAGAMKAYESAQWLVNIAMAANPIGLIVAAILILIGIVIAAIYYWEEWGAAFLMILGPLGWIINLIMTLRKHWDSIKAAFETDGIIGGFKRLGLVLLDVILYPLQQILELISKIPGVGKFADSGLESLKKIRTNMNLTENSEVQVVTPKQESMSKQNTMNGSLDINLRDKGGFMQSFENNVNGFIPVNVSSTQGAF
jgi:TP901 family phage tail tape measure protein